MKQKLCDSLDPRSGFSPTTAANFYHYFGLLSVVGRHHSYVKDGLFQKKRVFPEPDCIKKRMGRTIKLWSGYHWRKAKSIEACEQADTVFAQAFWSQFSNLARWDLSSAVGSVGDSAANTAISYVRLLYYVLRHGHDPTQERTAKEWQATVEPRADLCLDSLGGLNDSQLYPIAQVQSSCFPHDDPQAVRAVLYALTQKHWFKPEGDGKKGVPTWLGKHWKEITCGDEPDE